MASFGGELLSSVLAETSPPEEPVRHVADPPAPPGTPSRWPEWADADVVRAFQTHGVSQPWSHQVHAASLAHQGRHVVISTGTASGKSLAYQLPILCALANGRRARALYLSPTKALGHDQLRSAAALTEAIDRLADVLPASYDGDSPADVRRFARGEFRWAVFLRNLKYIVVDECHYYKGIFGSNVAMVLRRLLRLCARYSAAPAVVFASATTASPGVTAARLIGQTVEEVTEDGSPHGARTVALW